MKTSKELYSIAARIALGGAKVPHGVSNPVLRDVDGTVCVCYFVYAYGAEARETGLYPRPAEWIALDVAEGKLVGRYPCSEKDFSSAPYDRSYSMADSPASGKSEAYFTAMDELFEISRASIVASGSLDGEAYAGYLGKLLAVTPEDFRVFYRDLSL